MTSLLGNKVRGGMRRTRVQTINGYQVRIQRIDRDLAPSLLARVLRVSAEVINRLERGGSGQGTLTLSFLDQLARALGMRIDELFTAPEVPLPGSSMTDDDPAAVGALVAHAGTYVSVEALAEALGWTLNRVLVALASHGATPSDEFPKMVPARLVSAGWLRDATTTPVRRTRRQ